MRYRRRWAVPEVMLHVPVGDECDFLSPWGPIGGPPRYRGELDGMDPTFLVMPSVVGACLRPGGSEFDGILGMCDQFGYLTLTTPVGAWKYELFPAKFDDGQGPEIYLAVWPD
ncbi:hypothetical protein BN970_03306 [Mycolicibacterium conceptionense]|uniref:Uncharacterized protein n=1 Tax=Mycolicibacterium conceptionense TaxID=451644 RepID=A0A0U1DG37_9MYCO|nr:hypothetical protein BN970_03306 [Mycolicibacterium conceptionense]